MTITEKCIVTLEYRLLEESGKIIDSSEQNGALSYLHGAGMMMPGIEKAVNNREAGFSYKGIIEPKDGYGEYNEKSIIPVPKAHLAHLVDQMEEGKLYNFDTGGGNQQLIKIVKIEENIITVDVNHPYAGESISFECKVLDVREATEAELNPKKDGCGCSGHGSEEHSCGCGDEGSEGGCCKTDKSGSSECGCKH